MVGLRKAPSSTALPISSREMRPTNLRLSPMTRQVPKPLSRHFSMAAIRVSDVLQTKSSPPSSAPSPVGSAPAMDKDIESSFEILLRQFVHPNTSPGEVMRRALAF